MDEQLKVAADYLLAEHRYFAECYWRSEERGEKRANFFITLVTAIFAALITLHTEKGDSLGANRRLVTLCALSALLMVGLATWSWMGKRNKVSDSYKEKLGVIRKQFVTLAPSLEAYNPFPQDHHGRSWWRFGLASTMGLLNLIILLAMIGYAMATR